MRLRVLGGHDPRQVVVLEIVRAAPDDLAGPQAEVAELPPAYDLQSFSKPTTAKASFCVTPKEIIEVSKMQSFIAINFGLRSILRYYESSTPAIPTATRMLRDY